MIAPVFVDTNVLVYAHDSSEPGKQRQAERWIRHLWEQRAGRLSYQVLCELYTTLTAKLKPGLERGEAQTLVNALCAWRPVAIELPLLQGAWGLQERYSLSFWDALILAAAERARCSLLLSEDLTDGATYGTVTVMSPFTHQPA